MYMQKLTHLVECGFDHPAVKTGQGSLKGSKVEDCYIFRGVPYAESMRFMPPKEPTMWEGVRRAECFGPVCRSLFMPAREDSFRVPRCFYPESEDCQYLNIWTPCLDSITKMPVLVWLSGDGWLSGSSIEMIAADGANLAAAKNIVVVGVNHRQNVLGCLDLSTYGEKYRDSGKNGLLDILTALQWIRENIAAFGGDPDCVTLVGHGGGAEKIAALLHYPAADGLYHRVILESSTRPQKQTKEEDGFFSALVLEQLNLSVETVEEMEMVDWYDLATAAVEALWLYEKRLGKTYRFQPNLRGDDFRREMADVPMLVGGCSSEDMDLLSSRMGKPQMPVWNWLFDLKVEGEFPWHGSEVAYVFRNAAYVESQYEPRISEKMEDILSSCWANFVRWGDPNHEGIPVWEPMTTMVFDQVCHVSETVPLTVRKGNVPSGILPGIRPRTRGEA